MVRDLKINEVTTSVLLSAGISPTIKKIIINSWNKSKKTRAHMLKRELTQVTGFIAGKITS